jgi:hypothetical protein
MEVLGLVRCVDVSHVRGISPIRRKSHAKPRFDTRSCSVGSKPATTTGLCNTSFANHRNWCVCRCDVVQGQLPKNKKQKCSGTGSLARRSFDMGRQVMKDSSRTGKRVAGGGRYDGGYHGHVLCFLVRESKSVEGGSEKRALGPGLGTERADSQGPFLLRLVVVSVLRYRTPRRIVSERVLD